MPSMQQKDHYARLSLMKPAGWHTHSVLSVHLTINEHWHCTLGIDYSKLIPLRLQRLAPSQFCLCLWSWLPNEDFSRQLLTESLQRRQSSNVVVIQTMFKDLEVRTAREVKTSLPCSIAPRKKTKLLKFV